MFTGLIEALGEVTEVKPTAAGVRIRLATPFAAELSNGESVAVNGVCLTVVAADAEGFHADVSPETSRITTLGSIRRGTIANLERPLRADGRLGGHFVQGHVDALGTIEEVRQDGEFYWLTVRFPPSLAGFIVRKGSIAIDGISLTVAGVDDRHLDVQIIPYTWTHTNLHTLRSGDSVNVECDIVGKYVARTVELGRRGAQAGSPSATPDAGPHGERSAESDGD